MPIACKSCKCKCSSINKFRKMGDKKIIINKRIKGLPRDELEKLNKTELIDKIIQLEAYNFQLKNILQKKLNTEDKKDVDFVKLMDTLNEKSDIEKMKNEEKHEPTQTTHLQRQKENKRNFDFSRAHKRHVLIKLLYFGWDYQGFACQEDSNATIEYHLFRALTRACLIEARNTSNYHRCGRTDKEVSAFCQVISIDLRSKFKEDEQLLPSSLNEEIDYCGLLNRILPKNIQCIAWMPLRSKIYSARFDCIARTYRYFFPRGELNIDAMREACKLLERHADFRNFCKMDVHNGVTNYIRNLQRADIHICPSEQDDGKGYSMYYLEIKANAFLWHQIRCIMAVLLLIGQEKEEPNVISELLDVEKNPCKPQYTPAIGLPLNLFKCEFRKRTTRKQNFEVDEKQEIDDDVAAETDLNSEPIEETCTEDDTTAWIYNEENLQKLIENIQGEWTQASVKSTMIRNVLHNLEETLTTLYKSQQVKSQVLLLQDSVKPRQYQNLLNRKRCESLENRIEHFVKKQRLIVKADVSQSLTGSDSN